jgi:hypothetical protein
LLLFHHPCTHSRVMDIILFSFPYFFLSGKRLSPFAGRLLLFLSSYVGSVPFLSVGLAVGPLPTATTVPT